MRSMCCAFLLLMMMSGALLATYPKVLHSTDGDSSRYSLKNCVRPFDGEKMEKTAAGYQYWFVDKDFLDGRTIKLSVVGPGKASHPPHKHAEDEFFFILEGKAEFYLAGEKEVVGPQTCLYCPSFVEHGIRNAGDTDLKYLVIKKYGSK